LTLKFRFDPPLQDVDHLDIHVVEMTLRHDRRITRWDEADDVRLQQAIGGLAHAEIAVFRVAPQAIHPKAFRSQVTDIERLLLCGSSINRLGRQLLEHGWTRSRTCGAICGRGPHRSKTARSNGVWGGSRVRRVQNGLAEQSAVGITKVSSRGGSASHRANNMAQSTVRAGFGAGGRNTLRLAWR
jgi:hypothetical protein